jgi:hypothetical protein
MPKGRPVNITERLYSAANNTHGDNRKQNQDLRPKKLVLLSAFFSTYCYTYLCCVLHLGTCSDVCGACRVLLAYRLSMTVVMAGTLITEGEGSVQLTSVLR